MQTCEPHGVSPRTFTPVLLRAVLMAASSQKMLGSRLMCDPKARRLRCLPIFRIAAVPTAASSRPRCEALHQFVEPTHHYHFRYKVSSYGANVGFWHNADLKTCHCYVAYWG